MKGVGLHWTRAASDSLVDWHLRFPDGFCRAVELILAMREESEDLYRIEDEGDGQRAANNVARLRFRVFSSCKAMIRIMITGTSMTRKYLGA